MRHMHFIFKPTHRCNAACVYCAASADEHSQLTMDEETLTTFFHRIEEFIQFSGDLQRISMIWHGGEPLLMPDSFFRQAMETQERLTREYGIPITNSIQSNLLLLDQDRMELLKELLDEDGRLGQIGTSYDPIPGVRRVEGYDYNQRWRESVEALRRTGFPFGFVYVVHRESCRRVEELYHEFVRDFPENTIRFNPMQREGRAREDDSDDLAITPREWGDFLIRMYRLWVGGDRKGIFHPFDEFDNYHFRGDFQLACDYSGRCSRSHLGVDYDGTIYCCGRGIDRRHRSYGNVKEHSFSEIIYGPAHQEIRNRTLLLSLTECRGCPWWRYCHGGCPMDSAMSSDSIFRKTNFCAGRKMFFQEVYGTPREEDGDEG